jgi:hyperosmotically inducible periplasmic protein
MRIGNSRIRDGRARASARARFRALLLAGLLALAGCGGNDEAARIEELSEELAVLREGLPALRARVAERETAAKSAQDELAEARDALHASESRIAEIQREVGAHATDPLLFRMVQQELLEDDDLEDVAISARVEHGTVTLSGVVPNAELGARAVELAESVPGVVSVQSRIQVAEGKPAAAP